MAKMEKIKKSFAGILDGNIILLFLWNDFLMLDVCTSKAYKAISKAQNSFGRNKVLILATNLYLRCLSCFVKIEKM